MADPVRILIADDHELVRQGLRSILTSEPGWVVCGEATTGREAVAQALELKPDLLILDLALPELNGVEITRQLRRVLSAPILIVTMHDADDLVQEALEAGANGYVLKADAGRTLKDAVRTILLHERFISERVRGSASLMSSEGHTGPPGCGYSGASSVSCASTALGITTKTVETHRARIMAKLEMHSITELVRYAIRNRIIEP